MEKEQIKFKIDWDTARNIVEFDAEYDDETDTLFMQSKRKSPSVSVDCDGELWIRIVPQTGEIVGLEIEGFRQVFLKKHRALFKEETIYARPIADYVRLEKCLV